MRTQEQIDMLLDRIESIIGEYDKADDRYKRGQWSAKFHDRLSPYEEKLKQLNGDDFDIYNESYNEWNSDYHDLSDDDYVNALEENIKKVLNRIWPEATPEKVEEAVDAVKEEVVNTDADNTDKTVTTVVEETKPTEEDVTEEKEADTKEDAETEATEEKPEENPTDKFVKELEEYKANMPKRRIVG